MDNGFFVTKHLTLSNTDSTVNTAKEEIMKFSGNKPIFEEIASYYEKLISLGVYSPGDYLPSVRDVALENKVNPNTVAHAFSLLADKKVITPIPKKGYQVNIINKEEKKKELKKEIFSLMSSYSLEDIEEVIKEFKEGGTIND